MPKRPSLPKPDAEEGPLEVLTCDARIKQNAEAIGLTVAWFPDQPGS